MSGIAVSSTGYGHPKVVAAVQDAAANFLHICGSDFYFEGMGRSPSGSPACHPEPLPSASSSRIRGPRPPRGRSSSRAMPGDAQRSSRSRARFMDAPRVPSRSRRARRGSTPASARSSPTCITSTTPTGTARRAARVIPSSWHNA
jgi:hypothetical protein